MAQDFSFSHDNQSTPVMTPGNKEDWSDTIWNIAPDSTPFMKAIGRGSTISTRHEWMTETLKAASAKNSDAKEQGFTPSPVEEERYLVDNYTMILSDAAFVSRTQEKHLKIGIKSELNHQMMNKMLVLRKSAELACMARVTKRAPKAGTSAGLMAGLPGLVGLLGDVTLHVSGSRTYGTNNTTNVQIGEEDFEQDGTTYFGFREFKETLKKVWKLGSRPKLCFVTPEDKEYVSGWDTSGVTRNSQKITEVEEVVDVVITDFGMVRFIAHEDLTKFSQNATDSYDGVTGNMVTDFGLLIDPAFIKLIFFDDFFAEDIAKTKDGWTKYGAVEFTLEASAPQGIGIFDFAGCAASSNTLGLYTTAASYVASY